MRLRFWRRKPRDKRYRIKIDPKKLTPERMAVLNSELQNMTIENMHKQLSMHYNEIIGLRAQVNNLNAKVERLTGTVNRLSEEKKKK